MAALTKTDILLFSYGTLQDEAVQMANFGRLLLGRADSLPGYTLLPITIDDPAVVALSGKSQHMIAQRGSAADEVAGMVFEITAEELAAADRYEVAEYTRVLVTLKSGVEAWVYEASTR
ncbi:MAG TPA: gamma-glutamylcyclotransferase family protein [Steroidobacteraceae bacterium]|nr:gamma-glutamylcyclotransferase family protein [Steroidobacteraceae bacterium]